jgi:hypothetical protein
MMKAAYAALAKAQTEMGKALKTAVNPHLRSKYADLGAVMEACFDALHNNGFAIFQPCGSDDRGQYVATILAHESGDALESRVHLIIGKNDMQGLGSAITYARRYGLLGMAGIAPEDDDGEAAKPKRPQNDDRPRPQNEDKFPPGYDDALDVIRTAQTLEQLVSGWKSINDAYYAAACDPRVIKAKDDRKAALSQQVAA